MQHAELSRRDGVDAAFDRRAAERDIPLPEAEADARGRADLPFDKIDLRQHFTDGMLDLQAHVHLHEPEVSVPVAQKFQRAHTGIADSADSLGHGAKKRRALLRPDGRRGRLFEQLLVVALHGAVALAEADDVPLLVGEDLHLDVPRRGDALFKIDRAVAERGLAFRYGKREGLPQLGVGMYHTDAASAAARTGLEHDGVSDP